MTPTKAQGKAGAWPGLHKKSSSASLSAGVWKEGIAVWGSIAGGVVEATFYKDLSSRHYFLL